MIMREYSVSQQKSDLTVAGDAPTGTCVPANAHEMYPQTAAVTPSRYVKMIAADFYHQNYNEVKKEHDKEVKKEHNEVKKECDYEVKKEPNNEVKKERDYEVKKEPNNEVKKERDYEVKKEPNNEVKKEPDNEDSLAALDIDVGHNMKFKQNPLSVISSGVIKENDFIIKKEDKVFEVMIKQELDVGPTVLQQKLTLYPHQPFTRTDPAAPWSSTSSGWQTTPAPLDRFHVTPSLQVKVEDHHYEDGSERFIGSNCGYMSDTGLYAGERTLQESTLRRLEMQTESPCTYCKEMLKYYECRTDTSNDTHRDGQKYECEYCRFKTNIDIDFVKSLRPHMNKKSYKCHACEYTANQSSHLQSHMRRHTGEKPYKCNYCEYSASQFCSLQRHIRRHTGEKPYKCEQCEYSTSYLYSLQTHMRTHTGEKPYKCARCEYSASESSKLKRHMRMHTGEKPYKCKQCDYSTSRLNYLKTHVRRHTGEKPYSCDKCDYNASQLGNLKRHRRVHFSEKSYTS